MDSGSLAHDELEREMNRSMILSRPPDINLPLSSEPSPPPPHTWNDPCDILDVGLGSQLYEVETIVTIPKVVKKCAKRLDSIWGAWFFFSFYFKPVLNEKSKSKINRDSNGASGFEKSDLQLDAFLVQHDMENMYMWVFKERPENALGKMQLRSYMLGHSRQGEPPFPFIVRSPNLVNLDDEERKRWVELTGRDINFSIPSEASDFGSWRNLPSTEFDLERTTAALKSNGNAHSRKLLNGTGLNLSTQSSDHSNGDGLDLSPISHKRKHCNDDDFLHSVDMNTHPVEPTWLNEFSGVMKNVNGPVTAAKTIYEDDKAFLVIVSLPFADLQRVKVTWRNTKLHGIVKISCISTACMPFIKRHDRTFKLTDPTPEHCPPGEFIREIPLPNLIPEDAKLEAYRDETGTVLEIIVPKHRVGPEEHEVRVCLRPSPWSE
uniref:SHSP domain-containing protein n=1 Tax=Salix viminalis TaxID=40686 RepID=A0A6N2NL12_SALVM